LIVLCILDGRADQAREVRGVKARALTLKEVGRVRRALAPVREKHPEAGELARLLRLPLRIVQETLSGDELPSMRFAAAVAKATGQSTEALLSTPSAQHAAP
jgi:hypothetical protein